MFATTRKLALGFLAIAALAISAGSANAGYGNDFGYGGYGHKPPVHNCTYKTVIDWQIKQVPFVEWVTVVDEYGCARNVKKVGYKTIRIPVKRLVKVCHPY